MKPIQDPSQIVGEDSCKQTTNPCNSKTLDESDLAEIEQIVKEKMVKGNLSRRSILLRSLIIVNRKNMKLVLNIRNPYHPRFQKMKT